VFLPQAEGIAPESFSSRLLAQYAGDEEQIENIRWLAGGIFVGGSDTVCLFSSSFPSFVTNKQIARPSEH